ncbi:MAG: DUF4197 domain-containing protein [Ignavibacteriae bacterium]|nr:DUF4197 domain-containing protein [Ignavibacteriota bacterium]
MKKTMRFLAMITILTGFCTFSTKAQLFDKISKEATKILSGGSTGLTQDDAAKGIKEALIKGVTKGTDVVSKLDGYYKNPEIKIPFPPEAKKAESTLRSIGLGKQADDAILSMNRAAEDAAVGAKDIFIDAVKQMSIQDALAIIKGDTSAATNFLKRTTTAKLTEKFTPVIKASLEKVDATKYWSTAMNAYNKVPFVQKINPDLTAFVTQKAMEGLFTMIAKEEGLIRRDPLARTSEILKKVFGGK